MVFRRTRRFLVLVLLVVLQGGELLDGQLAVPPLVSQVVKFFGGRIAGRLGQQKKGIVATYLDATDVNHLQQVKLMAPNTDQKEHRRHAKKLLNCVLYGNWWNRLTAKRVPLKNVILPFNDYFQVAEAIKGTEFEKLICEVLKDRKTCGTSAVYAEPGVGKSVAAVLAVLQANTSETCMTVMLQGEFSYRLQCFFRSQRALDAPLVADEFFCLLHDHGIRLQMVIDNAFDACGMRFEGNTLINLGRRAFNLGHHLIVITQSPGKAEEVSGLNGARTRLAMQQQQDERVYRWSREQARNYLQTKEEVVSLKEPQKREQFIDKVLNNTQIPDDFGLWIPVRIMNFLRSGRTL